MDQRADAWLHGFPQTISTKYNPDVVVDRGFSHDFLSSHELDKGAPIDGEVPAHGSIDAVDHADCCEKDLNGKKV